MKVWEKQTDLKFHKTTKKDAKENVYQIWAAEKNKSC